MQMPKSGKKSFHHSIKKVLSLMLCSFAAGLAEFKPGVAHGRRTRDQAS